MVARAQVPTPLGMAFAPFERRTYGDPKLEDVVLWMRRFAHKGKNDPTVRRLVEEIVRHIHPGSYADECLALYYWVCQHIRYLRDPMDVEHVQEPGRILEAGTGDCDDLATLLAAMLMAAGNRCDFVLVGFRDGLPPSHVFTQARTPSGPLPLDPVANQHTARMLEQARVRIVVPV